MAHRVPLFFNQTDFSPSEMANADDVTLGKITLLGVGGVAIDGGHAEAVNFGTPLTADSLATKAYVDAVASGLDPHEAVVAKTLTGLGTQAIRAGAGGGGVALPMANESFDLTFHTGPAGTLVPVVFTTEANLSAVAATINAAVQAVLGGTYAYAVVNGSNIDLKDPFFGAKSKVLVANVVEGSGGDLVGKTGISAGNNSGTGFTAAGTGVGKTLTAPTVDDAYNSIDGVVLNIGQRVAVTAEGGADDIANLNNGIYTVTALGDDATVSFELTRATDADVGGAPEMHQGLYVFVVSGTQQNTGWNVITADPITVDTTPIKWSQFSAAPSYTFDQGLTRTLNSVKVDLDDGADAQGQGFPTTSRKSGLEFDTDDAGGQLRVAVAPAGGLQRLQSSPYGIEVKLDGATLSKSGDGLKVTDSTFSLVGHSHSHSSLSGITANDHHNQAHGITSADHTATGLTTGDVLTATGATTFGWASPGASSEAPVVEMTLLAGESIAVGDPVYKNATNGQVMKADTDTDTKCAVVGIARTAQATVGQPVEIDESGMSLAVLTSKGFVAGDRIYLKTGGGIHNAAPAGGKRVVELGFARDADNLIVRIIDRGRRAA